MKHFKKLSVVFMLGLVWMLMGNGGEAMAQNILGKWYNEEKDAQVEIYKKGEQYFGKIVWLKYPDDDAGQPKTDKKNKNKSLQSRPVMDMELLSGFKKKSDKEYTDGTIYDPKSGKTYDCIITVKSQGELSIRGYIGVSALGRTTKWTR